MIVDSFIVDSLRQRIQNESSLLVHFSILKEEGLDGVLNWTWVRNLLDKHYSFYFIPIRTFSESLVLVVGHLESRRFLFYDSLGIINNYYSCLPALNCFLLYLPEKAFCDFQCTIWQKGLPFQKNTYNCGLFICQVAKKCQYNEFDCKNMNFPEISTRSSKDFRLSMYKELMQNQLLLPQELLEMIDLYGLEIEDENVVIDKLDYDGTLSSLLMVKLNDIEPCFEYKPSK